MEHLLHSINKYLLSAYYVLGRVTPTNLVMMETGQPESLLCALSLGTWKLPSHVPAPPAAQFQAPFSPLIIAGPWSFRLLGAGAGGRGGNKQTHRVQITEPRRNLLPISSPKK